MNFSPTQQKDLGEFWACQGKTPREGDTQVETWWEKKALTAGLT